MIALNYKELSHDELCIIITECQQELDQRGTITSCKFLQFKNKTKFLFNILGINLLRKRRNKL